MNLFIQLEIYLYLVTCEQTETNEEEEVALPCSHASTKQIKNRKNMKTVISPEKRKLKRELLISLWMGLFNF